MRYRRTSLLRVATALSCLMLLGIEPGNAQNNASDRERGGISFGAFVTNRDSEARLDASNGIGTDLNLERDLGLDASLSVFRFGGDFWIGERHRIDVSAFDLSRSASRQIEETIEFGEEVFQIDTTVFTENDLTVLKADYTYAFFNRDRGYLGATAGLYIASTKLSLSEATLGTAESKSLTAPLPLVGLRGEYELSDRWSLIGSSQWFAIDTGNVSGSLRDLYLATEFALSSRWALGVAYNKLNMRVEAEESGGFTGRLDWGYDGWIAYVRLKFGR